MSKEPRSREATGVLFGLVAYSIWGFTPAYWKVLHAFEPAEVLAHRVVWSFVIGLLLLTWTGGFGDFRAVLRSRRQLLPIAAASLLLAVNWLVFIFAVANEQVMATSLGYYLNPLLTVFLGMMVLGERMSPIQGIAVAIAAFGVGYYIFVLGELPWISVALATSFGLYGLLRKTAPVEPVAGFGVEMTLLLLPALGYVAWLSSEGRAVLPAGDLGMDAFVAASGLITAAPLLCFNAAARRLKLVTIGILQYIAPSIALVLAVAWYHEPFEAVHAVTFGCVWLALAIFTAEAWWTARGPASSRL